MSELKRCPFCGNEDIVFANAAELEECNKFEQCECDYVAVLCSLDRGGCGASSGYKPTEERASLLWNRRTPDPLDPLQPLTLDELRERQDTQGARLWVWIQILQSGAFRRAESGYYKSIADFTDGEAFCCGYPGISYDFDYCAYGISWLAYDREPEGDA